MPMGIMLHGRYGIIYEDAKRTLSDRKNLGRNDAECHSESISEEVRASEERDNILREDYIPRATKKLPKAKCILEMPLPKTFSGLQGPLGIFNYQRDFIPMFANIAEPCYRLLEIQNVPQKWIRKNGTIHPKYPLPWTPTQEASFARLKKETGQALEFHQPNFDDTFYMETDASDKAHGGHIFQVQQGNICALGYHSKTYTAAQVKYSAVEKELLAIVSCTEHFHYSLYGRHFNIYSDHMPLTFLLTKSNPSKRLQRWMERLATYSFTIYYKPGKDKIVADALSRI
jgi:hypothetical protein